MNVKPMSLQTESTLLESVCKTRPIGIHKHFRMIQILKNVNSHSPPNIGHEYVSSRQIWDTLDTIYEMSMLDSIANEHAYVIPTNPVDFSLPDEYLRPGSPTPAPSSSEPNTASTNKRRKLSTGSSSLPTAGSSQLDNLPHIQLPDAPAASPASSSTISTLSTHIDEPTPPPDDSHEDLTDATTTTSNAADKSKEKMLAAEVEASASTNSAAGASASSTPVPPSVKKRGGRPRKDSVSDPAGLSAPSISSSTPLLSVATAGAGGASALPRRASAAAAARKKIIDDTSEDDEEDVDETAAGGGSGGGSGGGGSSLSGSLTSGDAVPAKKIAPASTAGRGRGRRKQI